MEQDQKEKDQEQARDRDEDKVAVTAEDHVRDRGVNASARNVAPESPTRWECPASKPSALNVAPP